MELVADNIVFAPELVVAQQKKEWCQKMGNYGDLKTVVTLLLRVYNKLTYHLSLISLLVVCALFPVLPGALSSNADAKFANGRISLDINCKLRVLVAEVYCCLQKISGHFTS